MSLSQQTMMDLMAYTDGELDPAATKRVEKLVLRDEEARKVVEAMQTLAECVRIVESDRSAPRMAAGTLADAVMARVATMPRPVDEERPRRILRASLVGAISLTLAAAAGFAIWRQDAEGRKQAIEFEKARASGQQQLAMHDLERQSPPEAVPVEPLAEVAALYGVALDHVESPAHQVSIFYVPAIASNDETASSVVVWIGDTERGL